MRPPDRFRSTRFESYVPQEPSHEAALIEAKSFTEYVKKSRALKRRLSGLLGRSSRAKWKGLYLVGPVGTGKTHLLVSMYHALHPEVPCAYMHSSELFRVTEPPEAFARRLAEEYRVLCLDEVELDDPANEARLVLVLKTLEKLGVMLLATSNVEPEKFLSAEFGNDRFRRFLNEEFRKHYKVVLIGGDDFRRRQRKPGRAWIGPAARTRRKMRAVFDADRRSRQWIDFEDFVHASTATEHTRLIRRLAASDALYLADVAIRGTDDALRLLRVIDDLYQAPAPPVLHFTSEAPPEAWLDGSGLNAGIEKGIAEKFARTSSRLAAMCEIEHVGAAPALV